MEDTSPAVDCAHWCNAGDGHADTHDGQLCASESQTVLLSRYPLLGVDKEPRVRDHLIGTIHLEAGASSPHVVVSHNATMMIDLSLEDAARFAVALLTLAEKARP